MRFFKIVLIIFGVLVLVAVAALAALVFVDPSVFRNQLETRASAAFGREFIIEGPISLERSLRPRIILEEITIGNPDWATGSHFATAEKVGVQVALFPLLLGDLRVLDVSFAGVKLFIEEGPDGADNYSLGAQNQSETPGVLPSIDQLSVKDTTINFRSADGSSRRLEIGEARVWNIPGEPERIEGQGSFKGMTFTIRLVADSAAELSGPQDPWSIELDIQGPGMSLALAGQMAQAFNWEQGDYRIKISGDQADSLEMLFGVEYPTTGPFEFSARVTKDEGSFNLADIEALIQGPPEMPAIMISKGRASGGPDDPPQIELQGRFGETPFSFTFESTKPFKGISQTTPWPIAARLNLADIKLRVGGEMIPATAAEQFELDADLQGENLDTLARLLKTELPEIGPYQFSFHTRIAAEGYAVSQLEGTIQRAGPWKTLQIIQGNASAGQKGSVEGSLDTRLDSVPLKLSFEGGPMEDGDADTKTWPLKFKASASGATVNGDGTVVATGERKVLNIAAGLSGNRFESLGPLMGVSLPPIGKFKLSADVSSDGDVHEAGNLNIQMGPNRLTGSLRWEDKTPRPLLTGRLSSNSLELTKFLETESKTSAGTGTVRLLDRPVTFDWPNEFDARLDLRVNRLAGSPIPVEGIRADVTLAAGKLGAAYRGKVAGAPVEGQIELARRNNLPRVSLKARTGRIDAGQTLKQLNLPDLITGAAEGVNLNGNSQGNTLNSLLEHAAVNLQIKPAKLHYTANIIDQTVDVEIESAELVARKDIPLTGNFSGKLQGKAFNAEISTTNLRRIQQTEKFLPVQLNIQTADVQLKAEGVIERPIENRAFELQYELSGKDIEGLDPLFDFVVPLRGAFRARGRITASGNRITYKEDLRIGKSDLKADLTVLRDPPRPKITGRITASQIHLDDLDLFDADKTTVETRDETRVIPDYTIPVDLLSAVDLDLDIEIERIEAGLGDLGDFGELAAKVDLKDGRFKSTTRVSGFTGSRMSSRFELNAAEDPPPGKIHLTAEDLDYGLLFKHLGVTDIAEGRINLYVNLSGSGATRHKFLANADGRISVVGKTGKLATRMLELWAADLVTTMLSPRWQREAVTDVNCIVTHIELKEGLAEIEDILLDTRRITVAGSGTLDLETEAINMLVAPRPKRASLVSLANPVQIEGTLSAPKVSVTRLPRGRRVAGAGAGLFAGLINPAFLIFAFSDTGTGETNPCDAAVERVYKDMGDPSQ
jgi:uncharacterized protein involved in outer membrane biogenesis